MSSGCMSISPSPSQSWAIRTNAIPGKVRAIEPAPESYSNPVAAAAGGDRQSSSTSNATVAVFYNALFDVPNPEHFLRIGMTAQVSIQLGDAHNALTIPSAALRNRGADGRYAIRVLKPAGASKRGRRASASTISCKRKFWTDCRKANASSPASRTQSASGAGK